MLKSKPWLLPFDDKTFTQEEVNTLMKEEVDTLMKDHFTQEQVNTFVAEEKRKTQERQKKLITELEETKKNADLTVVDRKQLEQRIEDLQNATLTAEEQQKRAAAKVKEEYNNQVETLTGDRDAWQAKHSQLLIDTEIIKAASIEKALNVDQIAPILIPITKLVECLDSEGKPSGIFEPKVSFPDTDKDEKPIILELSVSEAVKRLKELPQHGNLFEGSKHSGLGGAGSQGKSGKIDIAKIAREDQAAYRKLRKEKPELFA